MTNKNEPPAYLPVADWRSYITLFRRNPQYLRFWLSGVISQMGNWFNYIAIFVLLTKLTGSGNAVSWFLIAKYIPSSIFGPAAGVIADRLSRKAIMIASDLSRVAVVLCFLFIKSADMVWLVYVLALVQESIWTFYDPARRASVPNICRPEELNIANALSGATWSIMLAFGAALGGFITALFGWQTAIIADSATFIISAALLADLKLPPTSTPKKQHITWQDFTGLSDIIEGCRYVASEPRVAALLLVKSGWALGAGVLVLLTVFGEQVFAAPGSAGGGSGILYSFRGVGAAIGPILAWRFLGESRQEMYRAIALSFFVSCFAYLIFSRTPSMAWAIPFVLIGHIGGSVQWVFSTNLLQRVVPDQYRGRVFAAEMALLTLVMSVSTYFTGAALENGANPRQVMVVMALLFMVPGILWSFYVWGRDER